MGVAKVLVLDDELVRLTLSRVLQQNGFEIKAAPTVAEALDLTRFHQYDVLPSDLFLPDNGDDPLVVNATREAGAVTLLLSGCTRTEAGPQVILMQSGEISARPADAIAPAGVIKDRPATGATPPRVVESVATILERETQSAIQEWFGRAQLQPKLMTVPMEREMRCGYLTQLFRDLVIRLRSHEAPGNKAPASVAAAQHGVHRREHGYTPAMMVEESRILEVTIFHTLQKNLASIDRSVLLLGVMTIANECDSQLAQAVTSYGALGLPESAE